MNSWRSSKKANRKSEQPSLPGLSADHVGKSIFHQRKGSSHCEAALETARQRLFPALILFGAAFAAISLRVADLTLLNEVPEPTPIRATAETALNLGRADITDRNGMLLATSLPAYSLCVDTKKILDKKEAFSKLMETLPDLDPDKLFEMLESSKRCAMIKRQLTPRQYYEANKLGIAGLEFSPDEVRTYPAGNVTSHVLGYTDIDENGIAGVEKTLESRLRREQEPVKLSIDLRIQTIMRNELKAAIKEFRAEGAAGIIMDSTNGEILSLVSLPDFDPMNPGSVNGASKFNQASLGVYEMGSTFKIFNTAMALDSGLIKPSDRFDVSSPIEIGGKKIRDFHRSKEELSVAEIFMESSNIGSARMAERMGAARQRAFLQRLGLMEKSRIEIPENGSPIIPSASNWGETTTMTVSFGHGIAVSAPQLVAAVATIVNDGIAVHPTLLKKDNNSHDYKKETDRLISSLTSAQMRALMRLVVTHGTASSADVAGYQVGGKTGTSEKTRGRDYSEDARVSSFVGVFPSHSPRYVVFALLDEPKGNEKTKGYATGGWTAAPVVGRVIGQIGPLLNIEPMEPEIARVAEHRLLKPLGGDVLNNLGEDKRKGDYASVESNSAH